jgi:hypothetical protein
VWKQDTDSQKEVSKNVAVYRFCLLCLDTTETISFEYCERGDTRKRDAVWKARRVFNENFGGKIAITGCLRRLMRSEVPVWLIRLVEV